MHVQNVPKKPSAMYKLDFFGSADFKKVITDEKERQNKMKGEIFHDYYFQITFIQIINFVARVFNNYNHKPKRKRNLRLNGAEDFLYLLD